MPKKTTGKKLHRLVVEMDPDQFKRLKIVLLQKYNMTVSNWVREKVDAELGERVKGKYKTRYLS